MTSIDPESEAILTRALARFDTGIVPSVNGHQPDPASTLRDRLYTIDQLRNLKPPTPLIEGVLDLDSLAFLYGPAGSYKSFLAIDWALHVAAGAWWNRYNTSQVPVIYVVGEGTSGLAQRIDAWKIAHQHHDDPTLFLTLPEPVNLLAPDRVGPFIDMAVDMMAEFVIFDTLARCIVGGDENSAQDMGKVIDQLDQIRRATGACVLVVHHTGKDGTAGSRGSSSIPGAADTMLESSGGEGVMVVTPKKQKHHPTGNPIRMNATPHGDSLALTPYAGTLPDEVTLSELRALKALADIALEDGASHTDWKAAAAAAGVSEGSFGRVRKTLVERQNVVILKLTLHSSRYQVSDRGGITLENEGHRL